jgi:hypothetical protein
LLAGFLLAGLLEASAGTFEQGIDGLRLNSGGGWRGMPPQSLVHRDEPSAAVLTIHAATQQPHEDVERPPADRAGLIEMDVIISGHVHGITSRQEPVPRHAHSTRMAAVYAPPPGPANEKSMSDRPAGAAGKRR